MLIFVIILLSLEFVLPEGNGLQAQPSSPPQKPMGKVQSNSKQQSNPSIPLADYYSFNVTITHLSPRSIEISWSCKDINLHDKYVVTIKPVLASYKWVETVPNNLCYLLMDKLEPDTIYQVAVTSIAGRSRKRSGYVIFKTSMEDDYTEFTEDDGDDDDDPIFDGSIVDPAAEAENGKGRLRMPRVRLVEVSLVAMALVLWAGAILLFFHRWGKIRMLLPYQPDYKAMQNATASCTTCSMTPHHQCQKIHHIQNPPPEYYQTQGIMTTCHPHQPHPHTPHLPHQSLPEPGPSNYIGGQSEVVTVTESGCSPIRQKIRSFNEGDISIDMPLQRDHLHSIHRKTRSVEHLKQYVYPWEESSELECTEF